MSNTEVFQCRYCKRGGHFFLEMSSTGNCPYHDYPLESQGTMNDLIQRYWEEE